MGDIEHYPEHPKRAEAIAALAKVRNDSDDCACDGCLVDAVLEAISPNAGQGAVEALEKIEQRADPRRKLDGTAAAVALDSIYRWARKGLNRLGGRCDG